MHADHLKTECRRLHRLGRTNREIANDLVVPYGTVGCWIHRDRERGLLDPFVDHTKQCPRCKPSPQPPEDPGTYCYLLGQYLGDGHLAVSVKVPYLRITCANAYPGIMAEVADASLATLAKSVHFVRNVGCTDVKSLSMHWPCLIPQHGPGPKHKRKIELKGWQRDLVEEHPRPFLRGLIHSDGCRGINHTTIKGKRYEYPRYHFTNMSSDIMGLCGWAFDLVGVEWRQNNYKNLSVAKRASVAVLDSFIGEKSLAAPSCRSAPLARGCRGRYFLAAPMKAKSMPMRVRNAPPAAR